MEGGEDCKHAREAHLVHLQDHKAVPFALWGKYSLSLGQLSAFHVLLESTREQR